MVVCRPDESQSPALNEQKNNLEKNQANKKALDFLFQAVANHDFPGFVVSFYEDGKFSTTAFGDRQVVPERLPMRENFYFDLASLTKMFTAILTIKVFTEKNFSLHDPVQKFLPAFENKQATVMDLLTHTAQLTGFIKNRNELAKEELQHALLKLQPTAPIGSSPVYSDHHFLILGFLLAEITGETLVKLVDEKINDIIGSKFTFYPPRELTVPTRPIDGGNGQFLYNLQGNVHDPKAQIFNGVAGHAGLFGRMEDLQLFLKNLLNNPRFFEANQLQLISKEQTQGFSRSAGFKLIGNYFSHTGYTGTFFIGEPDLKKGMIFLCNRLQYGDQLENYLKVRDQFIKIYCRG
ncbi:serine hydrolase domain-containing protein [Enterococcus timonensis]|uniref:serine hydrolase domain-containing protein n=1 Tax=Enterococcus timonensis TaxID=1852364 RepID=UPI0008D94EF9|nr:serine hydrolase domain-containing protein [Enterococcus timonensis]